MSTHRAEARAAACARRRPRSTVLLALLLALGAGAGAAQPPGPERTVREIVAGLAAAGAGPGLADRLGADVAARFDFDHVARWAAGRLWRRLDAPARAALADEVRERLLDALARNLGLGAHPRPPPVRILPARPGADPRERRVPVLVVAPGAPATRALEFRCAWDGRWRVFDVLAGGASAAAYLRAEYRERLRREGPPAAGR